MWDSGYSPRRRSIYPEYKAGRRKEDGYHEMFVDQKNKLHKILAALGVCNIELEGREADDIIFNLTRMPDPEWMVMSEDKDMIQAVDRNVKVWRPIAQAMEMKDPIDAEGNLKHLVCMENFIPYTGFRHGYYQYWKALTGDHSDNVPNVLGDKAARLVMKNMKVPSLEGLYDALNACTEVPRFGRYCVAAIDNWPDIVRNYQVLDLSQEVLEPEELETAKAFMFGDRPFLSELEIADLFGQLEFHSMLQSLAQWVSPFRRLHA